MQETLHSFQRLYRVLGNAERLTILGLLAWQELSVIELATYVGLQPRRAQRHLAVLQASGVVTVAADAGRWLYRCDQVALQAAFCQIMPGKAATPAESFAGDAWERKVLQNFFSGMRLKALPMSKPKRQVITRWLLTQFESEVWYTEAQVNEIIQRHHPDTAFFRKELVGMGLMQREAGVYWRV